jgi:excisionase family DNA binding protein
VTPATTTEKLLTVAQVADRLGVAMDTVYKWVRAGRIPHVKLNKVVRFRPADLDRWIEANARGES